MQLQSFFVALIIIFSFTSTYAAKLVNLRHPDKDFSVATPPPGFNKNISKNTIELEVMSKEHDSHGNTHIKKHQTYLGYPVWESEIITHISATGKTTENGTIFQSIDTDLKDTPHFIFTKAQSDLAIQQAISYYANKTAHEQMPSCQENHLMVYVDNNQKAHWVFQVELYIKPNHAIPTNPFYLMDAKTFEVYKEWEGIQFFDDVKAGGLGGNLKTGIITYDGLPNDKPVLNIVRDSRTATCYLHNDHVTIFDGKTLIKNSEGDNVSVFSFPCDQVNHAHGNIYWDGQLGQVNGAFSPANDAFYIAQQVNQMYEEWYHTPVIHDSQDNTKPAMINIIAHDNSASNFSGNNACWDGKFKVIRLGDAINLPSLYPFVGPDVIAHELGHAFSSQHARFFGLNESGGMGEAFSDMAAKAFEYYTTGHSTWTLGPEQYKNNNAIRYLDEPTKDCQIQSPCSIDNVKNYNNKVENHNSAGIFNKVFYLLSTSPGWNTRKAFDVMVEANEHYWTPSLSFQEAACGVWDAANALSYTSSDLATITKVMAQVGLEASENKCS